MTAAALIAVAAVGAGPHRRYIVGVVPLFAVMSAVTTVGTFKEKLSRFWKTVSRGALVLITANLILVGVATGVRMVRIWPYRDYAKFSEELLAALPKGAVVLDSGIGWYALIATDRTPYLWVDAYSSPHFARWDSVDFVLLTDWEHESLKDPNPPSPDLMNFVKKRGRLVGEVGIPTPPTSLPGGGQLGYHGYLYQIANKLPSSPTELIDGSHLGE